jgi:hypothetical protein
MYSISSYIQSKDIDHVGFLADPAISGIVLRSTDLTVNYTDPVGSQTFGPEKFRAEFKGNRLIVEGTLDQDNYDIVESKITEYKEVVLDDVTNDDPKAKKFRAKNESESFIDLVPDVPTKQAFQKLKEYIDLISGE